MGMDNGEHEFSGHEVCPKSDVATNFPVITSLDTVLDEVLNKNTQTCTHTHTCNPLGRDNTHTHTCYHTHTQFFLTEEEEEDDLLGLTSEGKKKRPYGNREAVRKYRAKKKAHTTHLEEEVQKLRSLNQQLLRRLEGQTALEAELERLRTVLIEFRGKIDSELGSFPYQKPCSGYVKEGDCSVQPLNGVLTLSCETGMPCLHPPFEMSNIVGGQTDTVMIPESVYEITNPDS